MDWKERLNNEYDELEAKLSRLNDFIAGDIYTALEQEDRDLIWSQSLAMSDYLLVLGQRIGRTDRAVGKGETEQAVASIVICLDQHGNLTEHHIIGNASRVNDGVLEIFNGDEVVAAFADGTWAMFYRDDAIRENGE